jgi:hypothetical protein
MPPQKMLIARFFQPHEHDQSSAIIVGQSRPIVGQSSAIITSLLRMPDFGNPVNYTDPICTLPEACALQSG